jgi:undecaprenyl-diphosphatase
MSVLEAIVLGIVQGLTEFLPISSSGHLRIIPAFAGWEDPGAAFTAVTQLGTMAAVLLYFRSDLWNITRAWLASLSDASRRGELDARMGWYIIVGTIPISIFGLAFDDEIETSARSLTLIATALIGLGLLLLLAERVSSRERGVESVRLRDGIVVGFAQALALIPGVSRSGATITAGLFLGIDRASAARFSFLLSVPAVVLSGAYQVYKLAAGEATDDTGVLAIAIATILAFVSGYAAIAFLLRFLVTHTTAVFVVYRVVLGSVVLALAGADVIA